MCEIDFDVQAWHQQCRLAGEEATRGAGLSETMFMQNMHAAVHRRLGTVHEKHKAMALSIAAEYGYATAQEIEADQQWNSEHGYCTHGIELGHCPVGCDDHE